MAHEIETFTDGTAAFVSARKDAWHQLGTVTRDCLTAEQVMHTAYLGGWNVRTLPLTATEITPAGVTTLAVADHYATVRTHPKTGRPLRNRRLAARGPGDVRHHETAPHHPGCGYR